MIRLMYMVAAIFLLVGCNNTRPKPINDLEKDTTAYDSTAAVYPKMKYSDTLIIHCDSLYPGMNCTATHIAMDTLGKDTNPDHKNSVFIFTKNGRELIRDTIYSRVQDIVFADYNNDNIKDILVHHHSDVRSNWTHFLYLVDIKKDKLKKINGFEQIKNPTFNSEYNIVENYVNSGRNWTSFYKIISDTVYNYDILIYDGENEDGTYTHDEDYKAALKKLKQTNIPSNSIK